jgi:ferric-dicitrate binding protein FerR (iron transport regulator)
MMNERLGELLARYWTGRIKSDEKAEMEKLLLEHPDYWLKAGLMQQIDWKVKPMLSLSDTDQIADRIVGKKIRPEHVGSKPAGIHKLSFRWWKIVAFCLCSFLVAGLIGFLLHRGQTDGQEPWQQVVTANGVKTTVRLPDGSVFWVNAGSKLKYPAHFEDGQWDIYLTGEAYFKVKADPSRACYIHTADMDIRVLGTELDVKAYADGSPSETSLISGAADIQVKHLGEGQQIHLRPRQKIIVQHTIDATHKQGDNQSVDLASNPTTTMARDVVLKPIHVISDNLIPETAWRQNIFLFDDEPLSELAKRVERWYGVEVKIEDSAFAQQRFTGRSGDVSLEKFLHILQFIKPFPYAIKGKVVSIQ